MAIKVKEDIELLREVAEPLELEYGVVSEPLLEQMRQQHVIQYLANLVELYENIDLANLVLNDLEAMPQDQYEAAKTWYENATRDDSKKPQGDRISEILNIFSSLVAKRSEIKRLKRMCVEHLKHIERYRAFIQTLKEKNAAEESAAKPA